MKVSQNSLIGSFLVLGLLPYVLATFQLNAFVSNMSYRLFQRSLPGSLGTAPEGAVGYYQPPPGPIANNAQPTETRPVVDSTVTSKTAAQGLSREPAELSGAPPVTTNAQGNFAILTGTVTKTQATMESTQAATAGRDVGLTPASLFLSVVLTVLQL